MAKRARKPPKPTTAATYPAPGTETTAPTFRPPPPAAAPPAVERRAGGNAPLPPIKVRATNIGYFDDKLRRVGDVFWIPATPRPGAPAGSPPALFSKLWMERVDEDEPERQTSHGEVLRQVHADEMAARGRRPGQHTDIDNPTTGSGNPIGDN